MGPTETETPMAIDDADIGEILNEINIIVIDVPLQDQNNSTIGITPTETETSALEAEVENIKDQSLRRRKFNNASSARHRRNQKRKHEEMEQALVDETERNTRLTVEVELLEKQVELFKAKILDMIKKPRVVEEPIAHVVSESVVQATPEADDEAFQFDLDLL